MQEMPDKMLDELKLGYRFGVIKDWAQAAHAVATESQFGAVPVLWEFISAYTTLGVPTPAGGVDFFFSHAPTEPIEKFIFLTPIISADLDRLPANDPRRDFAGNAPVKFADFTASSRTIYLSEFAMTERGKGVLLLHEAARAHGFLYPDKTQYAEAWALCMGILSALGGQAYSELVDKVTATCSYNDTRKEIQLSTIDSSVSAPVWQHIFGPTVSPAECALWDDMLRLHAGWQAIKSTPGDPLEQLKWLLDKQGIQTDSPSS